ncbi:MAG TPA: nucleoside deaminase [Longimicrobiaceae bacterium]|nr:nucleoside deaminase [Longimicrobiaceae bacterium]
MSASEDAAGHETFLREAIRLSRRAMERGDGPFGAVLVRGGTIVLARENTASTREDATRHAEMNLVVEAQESFGAGALAECTLYSSTEPCAMCAGAIFWAGIRSVVFACPSERHASIFGPALAVHGRDVLASATPPVEVAGPLLEDEAAAVLEEAARRSAGT